MSAAPADPVLDAVLRAVRRYAEQAQFSTATLLAGCQFATRGLDAGMEPIEAYEAARSEMARLEVMK